MPKSLYEVEGFVALPTTLRCEVIKNPVKHYIYLRQHEPKFADEDAPRALFLVNLPVTTSQKHLTHLFGSQLSAGRVEKVIFAEHGQVKPKSEPAPTNRKRKRMTAEELEAELATQTLPLSLPNIVLESGSSATVIFVDKASKDLSLRNARRAAKNSTEIIWGEGLSKDNLPSYGLERYETCKTSQYPPRSDLLRCVDNYMTAYAEMEQARSQENAKKRADPDADGFITVTRGSKGSVRQDDAKELGLQMKEKQQAQSLGNFYRFQMRQKRREEQNEMLQRFESDKKQVEEMRRRRGNFRPET